MRAAALVSISLWALTGFANAPAVASEPAVTVGESLSPDLNGPWTLQVADLQHHIVATLTILFTNDKAGSCLSGDWKRVSVLSVKSSDDKFFPVGDPLSYEVRSGSVVIGRNSVCDHYLHLNGKAGTNPIAGEYVRFGWGSQNLGYFTLARKS